METLSLFDFYLKLCNSKTDDKILFMYISPEETKVLLLLQSIRNVIKPTAQQYADCIKNKICLGTITWESTFYSEMEQFRKSYLFIVCCNFETELLLLLV